jgi:hypothetical protein
MPSFKSDTLKLISNPRLYFPSFMYVRFCWLLPPFLFPPGGKGSLLPPWGKVGKGVFMRKKLYLILLLILKFLLFSSVEDFAVNGFLSI